MGGRGEQAEHRGFSGHRTTAGTCDQVTLPSKGDFAYVAKLRGDYPGGPDMTTKILFRGRQEGESPRRCGDRGRGRRDTLVNRIEVSLGPDKAGRRIGHILLRSCTNEPI